jgi:hypothetical protein
MMILKNTNDVPFPNWLKIMITGTLENQHLKNDWLKINNQGNSSKATSETICWKMEMRL